ncbi:MAG TPA: 8-oxo-dGTP diphosphatase [Candidatus Mcinerneyibacterium sp.]|nr:8-oxo-dGTP diphosphatase [Candidatus Mcinerneyibacterium sp.]
MLNIGVLIYLKDENNYLMIKRNKKENDFHEGFFVAPGGKREKNESITEAAIRELKEETGFRAEELELMGFLNFPDKGDSPFNKEWLGFVFLCESYSGKQKKSCPEGELIWVDEKKLLKLPMWEGDYIFTKMLIKKNKFDIKLTYQNNKLIEKKVSRL